MCHEVDKNLNLKLLKLQEAFKGDLSKKRHPKRSVFKDSETCYSFVYNFYSSLRPHWNLFYNFEMLLKDNVKFVKTNKQEE